jgi:hypothetical protein
MSSRVPGEALLVTIILYHHDEVMGSAIGAVYPLGPFDVGLDEVEVQRLVDRFPHLQPFIT